MSNFIESYVVDNSSSKDLCYVFNNEYSRAVFEYSIPHAIGDITSYWNRDSASKILNEDTFGFIWNSFQSRRQALLDLMVRVCSGNIHQAEEFSFSEEYCHSFISELYHKVPVDEDRDNNLLRASLAPYVKKDFDFLSEICRLSMTDDNERCISVWSAKALKFSKDENLYDYLYSKIKRGVGATDSKNEIISSAIQNNALSDNIISKIAKSSPKKLKRTVVKGLCNTISSINRDLRWHSDSYTEDTITSLKEKVARLEGRAMLFVGCEDYQVIENLLECLSKDNLPWLMPSASNHYYLSQRLRAKLED